MEDNIRKTALDSIMESGIDNLIDMNHTDILHEDEPREKSPTLTFDTIYSEIRPKARTQNIDKPNEEYDKYRASCCHKKIDKLHGIKREWVRYLGILIMLVSAGLFFWSGGNNDVTSAPSPFAAPPLTIKKLVTKNIEDIQIGERTLGTNPQGAETSEDAEVFQKVNNHQVIFIAILDMTVCRIQKEYECNEIY